MTETIAVIISCLAAVFSGIATGISVYFSVRSKKLQLSQEIIGAYKAEILRMLYAEPAVSIFQWYRKGTESGTLPVFSEIKGFFPVLLCQQSSERYFASAIVEVTLQLGEERYCKVINYDKSMSEYRRRIFEFIDNHEKEFRSAIRNENLLNVSSLIDKYFSELCDALEDR